MASDSSERKRPRIIIVEDNPFDAELIEVKLKSELGCEVVVLYSLGNYLKELTAPFPDLIISDSNLPTFDGFDALLIAKEKCPQVPFIFCSGLVTKELQQGAMEHGAKVCVSKDDLDGLLKVVRELCGKIP